MKAPKIPINYDDVTRWMAGEANQETRAEIARQLGDPNSPVSRHLASQAAPYVSPPAISWIALVVGHVKEFFGRPDFRLFLRPFACGSASYVRLAGFLSLLCGLSGCIPIDARPFYAVGVTFGVSTILLSYIRQHKYALSVAGLSLNVIALCLWPNVVGVFPEKGSYRLGYGRRVIGSAQSTPVSNRIRVRLRLPEGMVWTSLLLRNIKIYINVLNVSGIPYQTFGSELDPGVVWEPGTYTCELRKDDRVIVKQVFELTSAQAGEVVYIDLPPLPGDFK